MYYGIATLTSFRLSFFPALILFSSEAPLPPGDEDDGTDKEGQRHGEAEMVARLPRHCFTQSSKVLCFVCAL